MHGSKKREPVGIRENKVEVTKDELSKLMSVGTKLDKEVPGDQEVLGSQVGRQEQGQGQEG